MIEMWFYRPIVEVQEEYWKIPLERYKIDVAMKGEVQRVLFPKHQFTFSMHADAQALTPDRPEIAAIDAKHAGVDVAAWLVAANADRVEVVTPCCPHLSRGVDHDRHGVGNSQYLAGRQGKIDDGIERGHDLRVAIDMHDIDVMGIQQAVQEMTCEVRRKVIDGGRCNELKHDVVARADPCAGPRYTVVRSDEQDNDISLG